MPIPQLTTNANVDFEELRKILTDTEYLDYAKHISYQDKQEKTLDYLIHVLSRIKNNRQARMAENIEVELKKLLKL